MKYSNFVSDLVVKILLISSNESHLAKSKDDILKLADTYSINRQIKNQDMNDWSQEDIYQYYKFCLDRRVIPILNLDQGTVDLQGSRDEVLKFNKKNDFFSLFNRFFKVHEAETHFYKQTSSVHNALRLQAVAKGIIWSVESSPNSNEWEQYSFKLNGLIEDAHSKHQSQVNFSNEKDENCSIKFSTMEETCGVRVRRVQRTELNSTLPALCFV